MVKKVYYVSDGCAGQYKNHKNFNNLLHHVSDHGIEAEWHFTATAHGKNRCDAIGAVSKRSARVAVLRENIRITSAEELYSFCAVKLGSPSLEYILATSEEVEAYSREKNLPGRYAESSTIPGTRSYHSFVPINHDVIRL
jgi:hypothetical protein